MCQKYCLHKLGNCSIWLHLISCYYDLWPSDSVVNKLVSFNAVTRQAQLVLGWVTYGWAKQPWCVTNHPGLPVHQWSHSVSWCLAETQRNKRSAPPHCIALVKITFFYLLTLIIKYNNYNRTTPLWDASVKLLSLRGFSLFLTSCVRIK